MVSSVFSMQTFLISNKSFSETAKVLDRARLGKQRVETWQLYLSLTNPTYGWKNHPASKMWKGHEIALLHYGIAICEEWRSRGYKDTMLERFTSELVARVSPGAASDFSMPQWWHDERIFASHRSNLLRKLPGHYNQFGWSEPDNLPYVWPV